MSFSFLVYSRGLNRPHSSRQEKTAATGSNGGSVWLAAAPGSSHLLACSAAVDNSMSREHREIFGMRRLGEDRKGFFDQFHGTSLFKGVSFPFMSCHKPFACQTCVSLLLPWGTLSCRALDRL